jgi:hypothetical protein
MAIYRIGVALSKGEVLHPRNDFAGVCRSAQKQKTLYGTSQFPKVPAAQRPSTKVARLSQLIARLGFCKLMLIDQLCPRYPNSTRISVV